MKDILGVTSTRDDNNNGYISNDSNESNTTQTSSSNQETFFIGPFQTTQINKVTDDDEQKVFPH